MTRDSTLRKAHDGSENRHGRQSIVVPPSPPTRPQASRPRAQRTSGGSPSAVVAPLSPRQSARLNIRGGRSVEPAPRPRRRGGGRDNSLGKAATLRHCSPRVYNCLDVALLAQTGHSNPVMWECRAAALARHQPSRGRHRAECHLGRGGGGVTGRRV